VRLLFLSGTTIGGSGRSQRELAASLLARGHEVRFLVDDARRAALTRWWAGHLADLSIRLSGTPLETPSRTLASMPGRRTVRRDLDGMPHLATAIPQNALSAQLDRFRPDAVIASSVDRWTWRRVHETCVQQDVPTVLYVRETDSLRHLDTGSLPDALVANAKSLADALGRGGFVCAFVPSVIDVSITRTESSRRAALAINPVASRGGDFVLDVAQRVPDVPFVVQESWPLRPSVLAHLRERIADLPNVELRRAMPPGPGLYGDARVLLVPYRVDNRPRVIAEAHANGIPVLAADVLALAEAVATGGVLVPPEDVGAWADAVRSLWRDEEHYSSLVEAAFEQSRRPDVDPDQVTDRFEWILTTVVR
jgi:glycosyltransferase involved in cell wall biosynthesis